MSVDVAAKAAAAELDRAQVRSQLAHLRTRILSVAALAFVEVASLHARPSPGLHGEALGITIALIGFGGACLGFIGLTRARPVLLFAFALVAVASSAALIGLQPNGPGFLGVFPAVAVAAMRLPTRLGAAVAVAAVPAVTGAYLARGNAPVDGIVFNNAGVAAFYLMAMFARRLRESNDRAESLLGQLAQSREAQAQAAALAERQRLAREMHDVLAHTLSGLVLNLEGARLLARKDGAGGPVEDAIDRAGRLARTGLAEARRAIGMLRDDALPGPERLAALAAEFATDTGVTCTFAVTGEERDLSPDGRLTLYRVAQEALTNVRKHARSSRVELRLAYEPSGTRLAVEDFRAGGAADAVPPPGGGTGYGLTGMRERAALLGGTLSAGPTEGGFLVELWVPA